MTAIGTCDDAAMFSRIALIALPFVVACPAPDAKVAVTNKDASTSTAVPERPEDITIPEGSGDYRAVLALARRHQAGTMTFDELSQAVLARKLPPHRLGDGYLMIPSPVPPPGVTFDPKMMPKDWEGTWGEVAMAYWLGALTRADYDRLHAAAHPQCAKT